MSIIDNLKSVAGKIMNPEQEFELYELVGNGEIDLAKEYLLDWINILYSRGEMDLSTVSFYYNLIDATQERTRMFPQIPQKKQVDGSC